VRERERMGMGRISAHEGERKDGNGEEKKRRRRRCGARDDSRWATFESSVLARLGKQGGRGSSGIAVLGEQG
jgi:hypothetical protein